jgi:hypothetical protein
MLHTNEWLRVAHRPPPEMLEEGDVRQLDVGDHAAAPKLARGRHSEAHEGRAEVVRPPLADDREPVAFPQPRLGVEWVEAYGTAALVADEADDVERARVVVVLVVVIGREQPLLVYEDPAAQFEVRRDVRRRRSDAALE